MHAILFCFTLFFSMSAVAAEDGTKQGKKDNMPEVTSVQIQKGVFQDIGLCESDVNAAQTGIKELDGDLKRAAEKEICPGEAVEVEKLDMSVERRKTNFTVTRNDNRWLSIIYEHYKYKGGAHGNRTSEIFLYEKNKKRWVQQGEIVEASKRDAAARSVKDRLIKLNQEKYKGLLWLKKFSIIQLFTAEGCRDCMIYPTETGWIVAFPPYTIGAYASGTIKVPLDEKFIH